MRRFRLRVLAAPAALLFSVAALLSCGDVTTSPRLTPGGPSFALAASTPQVVISQVYGGGGNSGATLRNDFIELFNPGPAAVSLDGWSVQYASAAGSTWQVTPLSGTIEPGRYYLVQEAAGTAGTVNLPTPDKVGTIPMSGTAGKVWLVSSTTAQTGTCPAGIDQVSYGPTATDCGRKTTAVLSNTTAALRNSDGCAYSETDLGAVFTVGAPNPRNSAAAAHSCGPSVAVSPATAALDVGETQEFAAAERDGDGNPVSTTFTWSSSNTATATVNESGVATAVAPGTTTISATANDGTVGTATLTVNTPPPPGAGDLIISQVYGGGGNSGANYTHDFVELFNRGTKPVSVEGWSVQYASANMAAGLAWQVTPLSGIIPAGSYYLIREAQGTGGNTSLPAHDASGGIAMGAGAGKIALVSSTTAINVTCPTSMDLVPYGSTNCPISAPGLSNTTASLRRAGGCVYNNNANTDFVVGAPSPRNSATRTRTCQSGVLDHVSVTGSTAILVGATTQLTAAAQDGFDVAVPNATVVWSSSSDAVASVDQNGLVTGRGASATPVTITATATAGAITRSGTLQITVTDPGINWIDVSSSTTSMPPGFQTQLFATARQSDGGTIIPATFTFEAVDPQFATIRTVQNTGIVTAVAAPSDPSVRPGFRITATPNGGGASYSFVTRSITIETPTTAPASIYGSNDEFGRPTPASASNPNDFLIRRNQFTISYNQSRGTPNWVAYEIDGTRQMGNEDRCNCFTADPLLPEEKQILTSDYTNGGFDRGHMAPSADRTAANVDNATTFYLTNIVPQTGDLNQGVWADLEIALRDSSRAGRTVYIITGPLYTRSPLTFLKNEGKVAIPDATWKLALIGPRNGGNPFARANVETWDDLRGLTILAVSMPNVTGIRNDPWSKYLTTVQKLEDATGYDFLDLLENAFEEALEHGDRPPVAQLITSGSETEASPLTFDASGSSDPDLGRDDLGRTEALHYAWNFGDGSTASGATVTKSFARYGSYNVTLVVTDAFGWESTRSQSLSIASVPPAVAAFSGATILQGETYVAPGSFADPGAGPWTATVDYGDGNGAQTLALSAKSFSLSHRYASAGTFTVTVRVNDGIAVGTRTATVVVETPLEGIDNLVAQINTLDGLNGGEINSLTTKLRAASAQLTRGGASTAENVLGAFVNELEAMASSRRLSSSQAGSLIAYARRVIVSTTRSVGSN